MNVGYERKRSIKDNSKLFDLSNWTLLVTMHGINRKMAGLGIRR